MRKLYFILFLFSLCYYSCIPPCEQEFTVEIPFTVESPDTISIGDTIFIESLLPIGLNDLRSDVQLDQEQLRDFMTQIIMWNIDSVTQDVSYLFSVDPITGSLLETATTYNVLYDTRGQMRLRMAIIPNRSGKYLLNLYSQFHTSVNLDFSIYEINVNEDCLDHLTVEYLVNEGNRERNNYYLLENTTLDPTIDPSTEEEKLALYDRIGYFLFVVE